MKPPISIGVLRYWGNTASSAYLDWRTWTHRRVETLDLLEGRKARRRVSVDCTPLEILWAEREHLEIKQLRKSGEIIVPLTLMRKGVLRSLDVTSDDGSALPVLGKYQNAIIAASVMLVLVTAQTKNRNFQGLWEELFDIASGSATEAKPVVGKVVEKYALNESTQDALIDFADNFLLCAVMGRAAVGTRQVLKYSYHWEPGHSPGFWGPIRSVFTGLGFCSSKYDLEVSNSDYSSSYHLEVPAPRGLAITSLRLEGDVEPPAISEVGHVQTAEVDEPTYLAALYLRLSLQSNLPIVALHAVFSAVVLGVLHWFPEVLSEAQANKDSATTLLLLVPAFLFGLAARRNENFIVSRLLVPLRWISSALALLFLALAALFVVSSAEMITVDPYVKYSFLAVSVVALVLVAGTIVTAAKLKP